MKRGIWAVLGLGLISLCLSTTVALAEQVKVEYHGLCYVDGLDRYPVTGILFYRDGKPYKTNGTIFTHPVSSEYNVNLHRAGYFVGHMWWEGKQYPFEGKWKIYGVILQLEGKFGEHSALIIGILQTVPHPPIPVP